MLNRLRKQKQTRRALWISRGNVPLRALGALDQSALRFLRTKGHKPVIEEPMKVLGLAGEYGAVWFAAATVGAAADPERRMRWIGAAGVAPAAIVLNFAVKRAVGRQRPVITEHPALAKAPSKLSFPSAHATSSFAAAVAIGRVEPRAKFPAHVLAGLVCVGRPYLGMHYPSDVLAGATLGAILGRLVPFLDDPKMTPSGDPDTGEMPLPEAEPPPTEAAQ